MVFPVPGWENPPPFTPPEYQDPEESSTATGGGTTSTLGGSRGSSAETVFIGERRPSGVVDSWQPNVPVFTSKTQAEGLWLNLMPERREEINRLAEAIDPRRTGKALYEEAINAAATARAQGQNVTPATYINQLLLQFNQQGGMGDGMGGGTTRATGAYTGPVRSVAVQAESDIVAAAQATAQTLLGRAATDDELQKILDQTRKAERAQPTVTTRGVGQTVTEEGLTKEGRDAILKKVLMSSPDYASYQFDSTVMDMMLNNLREGQEVARGTF